MSFRPYKAYKATGITWLPQMPIHWESTQTKRICNFTTGWTPPTGDATAYEGENPWANISDLGPRQLSETAKHISDEAATAARACISPKGSLLFSFKLSVGAVSFAERAMYTNEAIATFHPSERLCLEFAYHAFPLFLGMNAVRNIYGAPLLNRQLIRDAVLPLPPGSEQRAIAAFLDRETSKIDALVAEQERLIELLKEKRQAVISHAITKGLNPDAPMKDSGIEWLGQVPTHWEEVPLKAIFSIKHGYAFDGRDFSGSGEYVLMTPGNFQETGGFRPRPAEKFYVGNDVRPEFILEGGQLLVAMTEQAPGLLGSALFVPHDQAYLHNQRLGRICNIDAALSCPEFIYWVFNSQRVRAEIGVGSTGAKVRHTSPDRILSLRVLLPPIREQRAICKRLNERTSEIDSLVAESQRAIEILKERRSALISAAVTGQIDVRPEALRSAA